MAELNYNFQDLIPLVKQVITAGRVPYLWGPPGIGKSALVKYVAELISQEIKQPIKFYTLDVPLLQPFDYAVGVPNHNTKTVELYRTGFLPRKGPAVVAVEDVSHGKSYQVIPLMQIVLDHRIGPLYFEKNVWFVLTGNREEDYAYVNSLPSPLNNRLTHFNMVANLDVWRIWAKANELDERVINFVHAYLQYFCQDPKEGVKTWPTPRSWHMLSDCIKNETKEKLLRAMSSACVGSAVTNIFMAWVKYLREIDTEAIITKGLIPDHKDRSQLFAIVGAVTARMQRMKSEKIKKVSGSHWMEITKWSF